MWWGWWSRLLHWLGLAWGWLVCRGYAFEERGDEVQSLQLLCLLLAVCLPCGHVSLDSMLCLIRSDITWGSYFASHFLNLSSGVFFTWRRDMWGICLSTGGELTERGVVGWGGTYLGWGRSIMKYEFLRHGLDPELLRSSRK